MDPISCRYTGKPFPFRNPEGRVALLIEIDTARYTKLPFEHTWGHGRGDGSRGVPKRAGGRGHRWIGPTS
jgi:hypothetical protein